MKPVLTLAAAAALVIVAWQGATAQQSADDVKWITACVKDNKDEGQAAPDPRLLHLHERQDVLERDPLDHAMGKSQSARDGSLRAPGRLEGQIGDVDAIRAAAPDGRATAVPWS
jgi:hypothetical protein